MSATPEDEVFAKRRKLMAEAFPLHEAVRRDCLKDVTDLLEKADVAVDAKDSLGFTPFALACIGHPDNIKIMRALLVAGSDPRQKLSSHSRDTAVYAACESGNEEMLELMIEFGVDVNEMWQETLLGEALFYLKGEIAKNVMELLLRHGAKVDDTNDRGMVALHYACIGGNVKAARALLEAGASVNFKNQLGKTPLHYASGCSPNDNGLSLMKLFLKFKPEVDARCNEMKTPLILALESKYKDKVARVKLLIQHGADIHAKTPKGLTPLNAAITSGCVESTRLLLELGAKLEGESDLLYAACGRGHHQVAEVLLDAGAAVNACGSQRNETPLFRAISSTGRTEDALRTIDLLAKCGADVNWKNSAGATPLHHASNIVKPGKPQRVGLLLERGADAAASNDVGETALHVVCRPNFSTERDAEAAEAARALLDGGADVEAARDADGATPFIHAQMAGCVETTQKVFEFKVDRLPAYDNESEDDESDDDESDDDE